MRAPPARLAAPVAAGAVATALALVAIALRWRGSDLPAHVFRVELVERDGIEVWNNYWYGGHHTLGYGVLFPLFGALVGLWTVAVASAAVSSALVASMLRHALGRPAWAATIWFAAGTLTNVAIGRLPFALGLAIGLGALWCVQRHATVPAVVLTVATSAASPVVSVFLAVVYAAWWTVARDDERRRALVLLVLAVAPVLGVAVLYPQGGTFPFRVGALLLTLVMCAVVAALVPSQHRLVRRACAVYALAALGAFVVPSPLGANVARLGMYAAGPVLLALAPRSWWRHVAVAVVAVWQWSPAFDAIVRAGRDPSVEEAYHRPLLTYLDGVGDTVARVEVVPTARHWEAAYIAPNVPLARGWERQLDMRFNALFYADEPPSELEYLQWLQETGVEYVALPDARLDPSGEGEAALLRSGLPYLAPAWQGEHWTVWSVIGATGMVDGAATLVELGTDSLVLDVAERGDVVVRVRASAFWSSIPPTCIEETEDGWIVLRDAPPGRIEVYLDEALVAGADDPCTSP